MVERSNAVGCTVRAWFIRCPVQSGSHNTFALAPGQALILNPPTTYGKTQPRHRRSLARAAAAEYNVRRFGRASERHEEATHERLSCVTESAKETIMPVPASLLIDDASPVNLMVWHAPREKHVRDVPNALARNLAALCERHGVRGKFSVLPMPAALGRIDEGLNGVSAARLRGFLDIVRERIAPRFDITCELLTHLLAYDQRIKCFVHLYEDEWIARASAAEITDYLVVALRILDKVGLRSNGVTSPWGTGGSNPKAYAQGIAQAFWRVHRRKTSWYLRDVTDDRPAWPWVAWKDSQRGLKTVSVPANVTDVFWPVQYGRSIRAARARARAAVDELLSRDGRNGRIRRLFDEGLPLTILTHWQCLFANNRMAGLWGLELLLERMSQHLGSRLRWMRCSELARLTRPRPTSTL